MAILYKKDPVNFVIPIEKIKAYMLDEKAYFKVKAEKKEHVVSYIAGNVLTLWIEVLKQRYTV